jgi:diadenosine tetraphosphate (Ap4A) HIT family hydrolase
VVFRDAFCRVVVADEPFPGFCRVVWNAHVREMTDLPPADRHRLMDVVFAVESALIDMLSPVKVNLASLGNLVPHLHWHVVPRFADDSHFPQPVWAAAQRPAPLRAVPPEFASALGARLAVALAV